MGRYGLVQESMVTATYFAASAQVYKNLITLKYVAGHMNK